MKRLLVFAASLLIANAASAGSSINNDDTCDIKVGPAATLLLPHFEVDVFGTSGQTTLFTITNVSRYPQIAHVTLWTDWAFPVLTFNIFLTGYDVQSINLADVLLRGAIAPPGGTSSSIAPGPVSSPSSANLRPSPDCANNPGVLPAEMIAAVRSALTYGTFTPAVFPSCSNGVGGVHLNAIGYATIDVVASCTGRMPTDPLYFTNELLFDNVLIGDYQQVGAAPAGTLSTSFEAAGNPMVHIRAVPEGGAAGSNVATELPFTFYDRYTPTQSRAIDRRQPLPSTFAARYIQGGRAFYATNFTIWREGFGVGTCVNGTIPIAEIVRFDERENAYTTVFQLHGPGTNLIPPSPATFSANAAAGTFPVLTGSDLGGWMYLDLNNGGSPTYSSQANLAQPGSTNHRGTRPSQNWVTVSMFASIGSNRMSVEFDAAPLGNGCSPAPFESTANSGAVPIGPAGGVFVCPPGPTLTNGTTAQCTGTNINPQP
ncbi:MAG TPA: hypothetical protein VGQ46_10625 [Thermoanaerobaculia bacterium]|jgi:hypothetical protein|nr:hypothetical protein [Thermoanaerobaculia bacterium]